jgi:hypothetical protein
MQWYSHVSPWQATNIPFYFTVFPITSIFVLQCQEMWMDFIDPYYGNCGWLRNHELIPSGNLT